MHVCSETNIAKNVIKSYGSIEKVFLYKFRIYFKIIETVTASP